MNQPASTSKQNPADKPFEEAAQRLLAQMSLREKIGQMSGDTPRLRGMIKMAYAYNVRPYPAGENRRLGIPPLLFTDGPRGVVVSQATCFPVSMARGATWDIDLEERVGDAMGVEARTLGANFFAGVCINVLRHPAWGRAQETYGEDPFHLGEMGAALVRGSQRHVMACAKHFAANSIENSRMKVDVELDQRTLREVYLPHFKRCVDEGIASIMSAYNQVNGAYCGHNQPLLRRILKEEWGFDGFVISDFVWGIRDTAAAAMAGCDLEMPFTQHYGKRLENAVKSGSVPEATIDEAVLRILRQKIRFAPIGQPERYKPAIVAGESHRALAREVAQKAIVLLKNEPLTPDQAALLPLDLREIKQLAVLGPLAGRPNLGDSGSSRVRPPSVVTPLAGIRAAAGTVAVQHHDGADPTAAARFAAQSDVAIVVVGLTHADEGERMPYPWGSTGGDRDSLALSPEDEALIHAVVAANPRTIVVLMGGSAIITEAWRHEALAILMAWYPGLEGGHALADILFGAVNPSAKLPTIFPKSVLQLPYFDKNAPKITYDRYHGYRFLERAGEEPAFPFGFGLSYTTFDYSELQVEPVSIFPSGAVQASVTITNSGSRAGEEIAQLYIGYPNSAVDRPAKELKGFVRVKLLPGENKQIHFSLPAGQLAYYDPDVEGWVIEAVEYVLYVGPSSANRDLLAASFRVIDENEGGVGG